MVDAQVSNGGEVTVMFSCVSERIWRMQLAPDGDPLPELAVLTGGSTSLPLHVIEDTDRLIVKGAEITLQIEREPWCVSLRDDKRGVICRENPYDVDGLNRLFILPLGYVRNLHGKISCVTESFHLCPDEHLYGLGEKFTRLNKVGQRITSWTLDALGAASERAYKNVPLLISSAGYGLFINTGRR
jgi:alpha-D-xyloside xylohydrolase